MNKIRDDSKKLELELTTVRDLQRTALAAVDGGTARAGTPAVRTTALCQVGQTSRLG